MYTKVTSPRRKIQYALIALVGTAMVALGLYGAISDDIYDNHASAISHYRGVQDYFIRQAEAMQELRISGMQRKRESFAAIEKLLTILQDNMRRNFKDVTVPAMEEGLDALENNSKEANEATTGLVRPEELTEKFKDATQFNAEIHRYFPTEAAKMEQLKRDLKLHHFDLGDLIKQVEVQAQSTHDNLDRVKRKLWLRQKYAGKDPKYTPNVDLKVWQYETKTLVDNLKYSSEQLDPIIEQITKLQRDCLKTADDIEALINVITQKIKDKIRDIGYDIEAKQREYDALKCSFWEAVFTLGISCAIKAGKRAEIARIQEQMRGELEAYRDTQSRLYYFNGIKQAAQDLAGEASKLYDSAVSLKENIDRVAHNLSRDFSDAQLEEIFEDADEMWIEAFTENYLIDVEKLESFCLNVVADCATRKKNIDNVIIWSGA